MLGCVFADDGAAIVGLDAEFNLVERRSDLICSRAEHFL